MCFWENHEIMAQRAETRRSVRDVEIVVDADAHFQEVPDFFHAYIDDEYHAVKEFYRGPNRSLFTDWPLGNDGVTPSFTWTHQDPEDRFGFHLSFDACDVAGLLDEHGIDHGIISGTAGLFANGWQDERRVRGMLNGYNNWLADHLDDYDTLHGLLLISGHEPPRTAELIDDYAGDDSFVGVSWGSHCLTLPPGHPRYDPIYEATQANDLPLCMHSVSGDGGATFPHQFNGSHTATEVHAWNHPFGHWWNISSLVFGGVPERYPELDFVFQEAGIGYAPYLMRRLDHAYHEFGYDIKDITTPPSVSFERSFNFTTQPLGHTASNPEHIAWLIDLLGPDSVMYSADLPHPDFDTPEELFDRINRFLDPDEVDAIMGGNAVNVFGL